MKDFALVTYVSSDYIEGLRILIKSFLKYNPWFDSDIIIYDWGLTAKEKEKCSQFYPKIIWTNVDKSKYTKLKPEKHYFAICFQKGEVLKLKGYKKLVVMDADLIVLEDIKCLFDNYNDGFYANHTSPETLRPNTGIMIIDAKYLTPENYEKYLKEMHIEINRETENSMRNSNENVFHKIFELKLISEDDRYSHMEFYIPSKHKIVGCPLIKPWGSNQLWRNLGRETFPEEADILMEDMVTTKKLLKKRGLI